MGLATVSRRASTPPRQCGGAVADSAPPRRQRPDLEQNERNVNGSSSFLATQVAMLERDLAERVIRTAPGGTSVSASAERRPAGGRGQLLTMPVRAVSTPLGTTTAAAATPT
jgi:hypothetical protein